ncbi:MAG TPA: hypothetical protein VHC69_15490 [Polyangiaceae bacterium]|nr:hypothetical protein [Polyangiaceae bacterium]
MILRERGRCFIDVCRSPEFAFNQETPDLLRLEVPDAVVGFEEIDDRASVGFAFVQGEVQVRRRVFPGFAQRDLLPDARGGYEDGRAQLGVVLEALHDGRGRKMSDEVGGGAPASTERVLDGARKEALPAFAQRRSESKAFRVRRSTRSLSTVVRRHGECKTTL